MGIFLAFFGKLLSWSGICEEEISEPPKDGSQSIPDDSISSDFHGSSSVLVSQLPAAISSCNTRSDNDEPISSHWSSAENNKAKIHFSGISIKEVISAVSSSACSQRDSLQSHSGVNYDSLKEILTCPQKTSTEPDSELVKSKKNASKKKQISLLNNQNEQLTGEASTSSYSDPQSSNPTTPISSNANAVSVPSCQQLDSSKNRHILAEHDSLPKVIGYQKTSLLVRQKLTSALGSKQNGVMMWVAKKESSCADTDVLTQQSHNLVFNLKMACLVNVSTNVALKKNIVSGHLRSEFSADIDDQESGYIHHPLDGNNVKSQRKWLGLQKTTSDIDSKQKEVMSCAAKEKSSSTEHLISIQQSQSVASNSKKSWLVDGIMYDELKKTTLTAYRLSEFCAVLDEQEYRYVHNSLKVNNGSLPHEKVCKSSTRVVDGKIQDYCSSNKILLVGEGDFFFSHFPGISIKEVISEESLSACSQCDSLQSHSGVNYDDDADSLKEILIYPQKTSAEPDSGPVKSKKNVSKKKQKAVKVSLLNNQNEQLTGEVSTRSHSDPQSSNPTTPINSNANAVSVPSGTLISEESSSACSQRDSLLSHSGINNDDADSPKEILIYPQKTSIEPDSEPVKSKKKATKKKQKAVKVSLLNNQNEQLTGEVSTRSHSDPQSSNPTTPINSNANAVSVPSGALISEESSSACSQRDSLQSHSGINNDDADSPKEILVCLQKTSTEPDSEPVKSKKKATKKKQKAVKVSLLNNQNEQLTGEASTRSHSDPQSSNPTTPISSNANAVSVPSMTIILVESLSACSQRDSLLSHSGINYDDADSQKEILICPQKMNTEPDLGPVKSKKNATKKRQKAVKISLLNNQNEQLTGDASTRSHSDPQSSNPTTPISSNADAVSVPSCQQLDSSKNRHILAEHDSLPKVTGSKKTSLLVRQTVTSAVGSKQNGVMMWVAKKESSRADSHALTQQSHNLESNLKTACLVNVSTNAALKKNTVSGHLQSEVSADGNNVESQKKWLGLQKTTSDIDSKRKEVMSCAAKEKSCSTEHLISIQQSQSVVSNSKKSCLVDGITYDELKKTTLTAYPLSEFCAALDELKYRYVHNSLKGNNGSHPHENVCKSSTKVVDGKIQGYCSSNKILLVGEGDFSFSACLAKAFGSATNMVATSLNPKAYLKSNYKDAMNNIFELRSRGCKVLHGVDATSMAIHKSFTGLSFNQIIYNFPHCGDFSSTETALSKNQSLVKLFMENASKMIEENGEIHIRHKVNWFFSKWNLEGLASEAGLVLIEKAPFDVCEFKGYNTKYGFEVKGDKNFDCRPSCTYKFGLSKRKKKLRRRNSKLNA